MHGKEPDVPDETFYDFADFRLDAARRLLSHRTQGPVAITSRAFDALLHFVRNPGRLVPKRELMDAVWGDSVIEENNLAQTVSTLRQLLGETPDEHRFIVTISGKGYRFIAPVTVNAAAARPLPPAPAPPPRRWLIPALALALVLVVIAFVTSADFTSRAPIRSIAVLPFRPLVSGSGDPALELGMADTLIARLASGGSLVVRPLSSV